MGMITFNGRSSDEFGTTIEQRPDHTRGSRRGELIEVPGRNGAMVLEDGSYTTYTQSYVMAFEEGDTLPPYRRAAQVAEWLLGSKGFCRLEDDFEPGFFRLARYAGPLNINQVAGAYGRCTLEFECEPQRYLKAGEARVQIKEYEASADVVAYDIPSTVAGFIVRTTGSAELTLYDPNNRSDSEEVPFVAEDGVSIARADLTGNRTLPALALETGDRTTICFADADGSETEVLTIDSGRWAIHNPTANAARPLLRFDDVAVQPAPVEQTITQVPQTGIGSDGSIVPASHLNYSSSPISLTGYVKAIVSGLGYSFFDANGNSVGFSNSVVQEKELLVPSNAKTIVVGGSATYEASLYLQAPRPDPGNAAVTIGTTTISLDFSEQDIIILDCDTHDAYYLDGSNANKRISFADSFSNYPTFPVLPSGDVSIKAGDGENLDFFITPRWWTL